VKPPDWWLQWRLAKTGRVAINPPALVVKKAIASSLAKTSVCFF
jgi:hypothetical protein